jgi:uncharacterized RDD family membrane protein YckC
MATPYTQGPNVHVTGRRIVAVFLDGIVFSLIGYFVFGLQGDDRAGGMDFSTLSTGGSIGMFVVVLAYYTLLEGLFGRTLGKMITGIRVVDARTGSTPGIAKALGRTFMRIIDGFFGYLLGWIVILCSSNRRRLGDMAAGTLVVRT